MNFEMKKGVRKFEKMPIIENAERPTVAQSKFVQLLRGRGESFCDDVLVVNCAHLVLEMRS